MIDDDIRALRDEVERLRMCADELKEVTAAADDPRINLTITLAEYTREVKDEIERLRADAERYRWLRGDSCMDHSARWTQWEVRRWDAPIWTNDLRRADLDAAIDDAMRKEPDHAR